MSLIHPCESITVRPGFIQQPFSLHCNCKVPLNGRTRLFPPPQIPEVDFSADEATTVDTWRRACIEHGFLHRE